MSRSGSDVMLQEESSVFSAFCTEFVTTFCFICCGSEEVPDVVIISLLSLDAIVITFSSHTNDVTLYAIT